MSLEFLYLNGEPVHAGDRIQHRGDFGRIVFVTDGDQFEAEPGYDDYAGSDRGFHNGDGRPSLPCISSVDAIKRSTC